MKIIDLLVKIANGEEVPKEIIGKNSLGQKEKYIYNDFWYIHIFENPDGEEDYYYMGRNIRDLNDEVEIIEEEKELHANEIVFNCDNNKRECVVTLDENDLGIDKLHMDNCYFYKENGKWYVKKYDFKTIKLEEEKKIPEKLEDYSLDEKGKYPIKPTIYEEILKDKINEIIDYLKENKYVK